MSRSSLSASRSLRSCSRWWRCGSSRGEERSRARAELSRQALGSVALIEEFADKRLRNEAGAPADFTDRLGGITAARVYFVGRSGLQPPIDEVRFGKAPAGTEARLDWKLLGKTGKARQAQTFDLKLADGTSTLAAAGGFRYGGQLIGAIVVARPVRSINASTLVQGRRFVPPLLLAVAAAALVALLLSRRITRPVQELTEASEKIARGDYDVHLTTKGPDELGQLALRFEQMARRLQEASVHERNFLMRISHELRTPLTAIQGHVQAISDGVIDGKEEQQASLDIVLAEAGRLQRLIGDLLDLARLETRKFSLNVEEVDLFELCEQVVGAQREEARHARARPARDRGCEAGRPRRRRPHPADRHEPRDECPACDARRRRDHRRRRAGRGRGTRRGERHRPGHPLEERESILRPFVTSDVRDGIGLGLPVASELAHAMGGTLVVGERPGGGAAFTLSLPLAGDGRLGRAAGLPRDAEPESELVAE